jgi:hypothetical protein
MKVPPDLGRRPNRPLEATRCEPGRARARLERSAIPGGSRFKSVSMTVTGASGSEAEGRTGISPPVYGTDRQSLTPTAAEAPCGIRVQVLSIWR